MNEPMTTVDEPNEVAVSPPSKPRGRLKWLLLAAVLLAMFWCGSWLWGLRQQLAARNAVETAGGWVKTSPGLFPGRLFESVTEVYIFNVSPDQMKALWPQLIRLEGLERLTMLLAAVNDDHLYDLQSLPKLRSLGLLFTRVRGPGLAFLQQLPDLYELRLGGVKDEAVPHLHGCPARWLGLYKCADLTDEGIKRLGALPNLEHLELVRTSITKEGAKSLQAELPGVQVVHQNDRWKVDADGEY